MAMSMSMAMANPSMTLPLRSPLHRRHAFIDRYYRSVRCFTANTKLPLFVSTSPISCRLNSFSAPKSSVNGFSVYNINLERSEKDQVKFPGRFRELVHFIRSILPGGSWWSLSDHADIIMTAEPVTVLRALQRMWELVANDRWVIFTAFSALVLAAVRVFSSLSFILLWLEHYVMCGNWEIGFIRIRFDWEHFVLKHISRWTSLLLVWCDVNFLAELTNYCNLFLS